MKKTIAILILLLTWLLPATGRGAEADSEVEGLRRRLRAVETMQQQTLAELDRLRAVLEEGRLTLPPVEAADEEAIDLGQLADDRPTGRPIEFHGHLSFAYFGFEEVGVAPGTGSDSSLSDISPQSSFSLSDISFFMGIPLGESLYIASEVEYEIGGDQIDLDEAFLQWDLETEHALALRMGKFYVPFGIERFYQNSPQNPLVDRPSPFIHVIPGTFSDTGIALLGRRPLRRAPEVLLEYELAIMNGLDADLYRSARDARANSDNNASKTVGGRIGISYDRWLRIGVSALTGEYDDGDEDQYDMFGADLRVSWGAASLRGEYVYAHIDRPDALYGPDPGRPCSDVTPLCRGATLPLTPLGGSFHRSGWYLEGTVRHRLPHLGPLDDLEYVLRVDDLDEDDSVRDLLDARRLAIGVVLRPLDHLRLKLQAEFTDEDAHEFDNNALLFEGSVDW